jgi:dipeptidyl aminopeptidase/acylaminoacyl peptidase
VGLPRFVPTPEQLRQGYVPLQRASRPRPQVYMGQLKANWYHDNNRFWYRHDLRGGEKEFIVVDAEHGVRQAAFDHDKLSAALSKAAGKPYAARRLPFDSLEFVEGDKVIRFQVEQTTWQCNLATYECVRVREKTGRLPSAAEALVEAPVAAPADDLSLLQTPMDEGAAAPQPNRPGRGRRSPPPSPRSPDGKWTAFIKGNDVYVRATESGQEIRLSSDGREGNAYGLLHWAPDSQTLAAFRIEPGDHKQVYLIQSSPPSGGRARFHQRAYDLPGDKLDAYELNLFSIKGPKQIKPHLDRVDLDTPRLHWSADGSRCRYEKADRGHQRFRLIEVDALTGDARNLIDETAQTFIWTAHTENVGLARVNWLDQTQEIIYASERDGWRHLYLVDARLGKIKNPITRGDWVVRGIDHIDPEHRQVWFRASGRNPDQDPYFIHYYRVNFDGTNLVALTAGNGNHTVQWSPDRNYLIDTYSRADMPPVHELRRASDGKLLCELEKADIRELEEAGWQPPEVFVAKGRDGRTDIWGILCRPRAFDPGRKYPVVESIYAGPHGSFVPKSFSAFNRYAALTELGFIVVQIDGMGTANRSKAFHDVCWHNLKDAGYPDRIAWHRALARKYPYYDLDRVGIYGTSAGGQNAAGALLFHGDFYKAAVAACGCHDNRMDKASWNEQWMGYPVGPHYADNSNITHAGRLRGQLLLILGEMDTNVPPESTYRLVDALVKAGKDFELLVIPGLGHSNGGTYGVRRLQNFFVRHLHRVEPPDWTAASVATTAQTGVAGAESRLSSHDSQPLTGVSKTQPRPHSVEAVVAPPPESFFAKIREKDRDVARKFYAKYLDVNGLPVAASASVADEALERTSYLVTHLLAGRPDILRAMVKQGTRLIIIGKDQVYTDMPEYRHHPNPAYQNERVRGTGGFDITSFGEENLLNLPIDRYDDESIAVHEFCHTIDAALRRLDPGWRDRLVRTYRSAMSKGLWKNAYTSSNPAEYWAELCQSYFDCNRVNNWNHAAIGTREQLRDYDPDGYDLVKTTFRLTPANDWRYRPLRRQPSVTRPPERFQIDPYYTKFTYAREFIVLGSDQVSDQALLRVNDTIRKMFAYRHDILKAMIANGARLVVLGRSEKPSDLPEFKHAGGPADFDQVRYLDYMPSLKLMVVPEENVLGLPGEPFAGKDMVVSTLARALYQVAGLRPVDPDFDRRPGKQQYELRVKRLDIEFDNKLRQLYEEATQNGLWKGTPAARDRADYWVAGVLAYFDAAGAGVPPNLASRPIITREALQAYDPGLFSLVDETMAYTGHVDWRVGRSTHCGQ